MSYLKQLKSRDTDERKQAIRAAAKALDRNALKQLAIMAGDDPDKDIRKLAQQAGVYIRQKLGEIPSKDGKPSEVAVSPEQEEQAKRYVKAAMTANINDDKAKAIKALSKALSLNPNLRTDGYFISLCEQSTGAEGEAAILALGDESRLKETEKQEARERSAQDTIAHREQVSKFGWRDVGLDVAMLAVISLIGGIVLMFFAVERADAFNARYEGNQEDVALAIAEGRYAVNQDGNRKFDKHGSPVYVRAFPEPGKPTREFTDMFPVTLTDYWDTVQSWRGLGIGDVIVRGLMFGGAILGVVIALGVVVHMLMGGILRGAGSLPFTLHNITTFAIGRTMGLLVVIGGCVFLFFGTPGEFLPFMGVIGLYLVLALLSMFGVVSRSYRMKAVNASTPMVSPAAG